MDMISASEGEKEEGSNKGASSVGRKNSSDISGSVPTRDTFYSTEKSLTEAIATAASISPA